MNLKLDNSQGKVFYGMHFYPGVARYEKPGEKPLDVFINEDTIRKMGPSFAARPVFVEHVEEVDPDLNELRSEADGWVVESFFNEADGKNWVKFIVVSERGLKAIEKGFRLSNAYVPQLVNKGGTWSGFDYQKTVVGGEFDHLAIVQNPRYDESVIMTPEQYKEYNATKKADLMQFANSKDKKGDTKMKLNIFKRAKVENSVDIEGMMVELPKSKKEVSITKAIEEYDKFLNMNGYANGDHMVKVGDKDEMSVNDLVQKHMDLMNEVEEMKAKNAAGEDGGEPGADDDMENDDEDKSIEEGAEDVDGRGSDKSVENEEDEEDGDKKPKEKVKNEKMTLEQAKKLIAKEKALKLKNANQHYRGEEDAPVLYLPKDQVALGKALYGSGNK